MSDARRNQVDASGHRDEIRVLLAGKGKGKPTWAELSEEIRKRFGVVIRGSMLRWYRDERMGGEVLLPPERVREELERRSARLDVCAERARLFKLQVARLVEMLKVDAGDPRVGSEVRVAAEILTAYRTDLLELGVVARAPKVGVGVVGVVGIEKSVELARSRLRAAAVDASCREVEGASERPEMVVKSDDERQDEEVLEILKSGELPPTPRGAVTRRPPSRTPWPYTDEKGRSIKREEWLKRRGKEVDLEEARGAPAGDDDVEDLVEEG